MIGNQNVYLDTSPNFLNYFKYASITSVDVERIFSLYKHIRGVFRITSRGRAIQIFSLIQAQNVQVKFLVIFISGESLIFVVFFFFF
jgi:hypothetical protein